MADGDKPPFDPSQPYESADKPPFDPSQPYQDASQSGGGSTLGALWQGIKSGATAGFNPQISGALASSGLESELPYLSDEQLAAVQKSGGVPGAYTAAATGERQAGAAAQAAHPNYYGMGELGGAVAGMALAPEGEAVGLTGRLAQGAKLGAGYGALSGASEAANQGTNIGTGAITGSVEGAIGGVGGAGLSAGVGKLGSLAYDAFGRPIVNAVRGALDPVQEAARRIAGAWSSDVPQSLAGVGRGLTPSQYVAAYKAGDPVMPMDMGETSRALMRWSANSDPEARAIISDAVGQRFAQQSDRGGSLIRSLVSGGANTAQTADRLQAEYDAERGAAYGKAYAAGDRPITSPELDRLMGAPDVQGALQDAIKNWKNWQVLDGYGGMNSPFQITEDGRLIKTSPSAATSKAESFWDRVQREQNFGPSSPSPQVTSTADVGVPTYPNLQLWDYTARNLADTASAANRAGNNQIASRVGGLATQLKSALDKEVPEYAEARGVAAQFFGGNNAIEAGQNAINFKGDVSELQRTLAGMKPAEREIFQEAYADAMARKVENLSDNQSIVNRVYQSPEERQRVNTILGQGAADRLGAFVDRERIYDSARQALGNSTTVRQMIEMGLAGSLTGSAAGYMTGDWRSVAPAALAGAAARSGFRSGLGYVDRNVARRVAEMITSPDPRQIIQGIRAASSNPRIASALRETASRASTGTGAMGVIGATPRLQLTGPTAAQPDQQSVPGPIPQQRNGGKIKDKQAFAHGGSVKSTKAEVHYHGGTKARRCADCNMFQPPRGCSAVRGSISPHGVCDLFERKAASKAA